MGKKGIFFKLSAHSIHVWCIYLHLAIWLICMVNVAKYTIHGCYGLDKHCFFRWSQTKKWNTSFFHDCGNDYGSLITFLFFDLLSMLGGIGAFNVQGGFSDVAPQRLIDHMCSCLYIRRRSLIHNSFIPDGKSISTFHWLLRRQGSKSRLEDLKQLANQRKSWREGMKHFFAIFISQYFKHVT